MPLLAHWEHDLSPFIIRIWGDWGIRWYGTAYLVGILLSLWFLLRWQKQRRLPLTRGEVVDFLIIIALSMMVGGRLGYCLFYASDRFFTDPLLFFRLMEGGMASHGGIIGILTGVFVYGRVKSRDPFVLIDALGATAGMGIAAGRIANFINGELWGRPSNVPWAVIFPAAPDVDGVNVPRHPSQRYAAGMEGLTVLVLAMVVHKYHRRPGLTAGTVLVSYSVMRFIDEFWREPDIGHNLVFGWMSKGQSFSLPVLLIGLGFFAYALSRPPKPQAYEPPEVETDNKS